MVVKNPVFNRKTIYKIPGTRYYIFVKPRFNYFEIQQLTGKNAEGKPQWKFIAGYTWLPNLFDRLILLFMQKHKRNTIKGMTDDYLEAVDYVKKIKRYFIHKTDLVSSKDYAKLLSLKKRKKDES